MEFRIYERKSHIGKKTDFVSAFNAIVFKKEKITLNNQ